MPVVKIDVLDVLGEAPNRGDKVIFRAKSVRGSDSKPDGVIVPRSQIVDLVSGVAEVFLEPGACLVQFRCGTAVSTTAVEIAVPNQAEPVTLRALLEETFVYEPSVVSAVSKMVAEAAADAQAADSSAKAAAASENGATGAAAEAGAARDEAVDAATAAAGSETAATGAAATATTKADDAAASAAAAKASEDSAVESAMMATTAKDDAVTAAADATDARDSAQAYAGGAQTQAQAAQAQADRSKSEADRAALSASQAAETASSGTPDATTDVKGKVRLAGDLAGTADAPTVPKLAQLPDVPSTQVDVALLIQENRADLVADHPYADPSAEDVQAMEKLIDSLLRGDDATALSKPSGVEVISGWSDAARRAVTVVRSKPDSGLYWGVWVLPSGVPFSGMVEAPHPVFDSGSDDIATKIWLRSPVGTVLAVAGSHRTNPDGTDPRDVAHNTNSMWYKVTAHIAQPGLPELQLHGFGDDSMPGVGAVVSSGSSPLSSGVVRMEAFVANAGIMTARQWDGSATSLIGMSNIQGDAAAVRGNPFGHVELSKTTRDTKAETFVDAVVASGFLAGGHGALLTNEYPKPVGSANSRGQSSTAARADHTHRLVQNDPADGEVVVRQAGGWRSVPAQSIGAVPQNVVDAATQVEAATYSATAGSLMKRTSTGAVSVATPTAGSHAANKSYVDGATSAKADLVGGKVPTAQIPAVALTKPFVVSDRAGMLALTAEEGDVAVITTGADKGTYMLGAGAAGTFSSWVRLASPDGAVSSVNGQTGVVNLSAADVGASTKSYVDQSVQLATSGIAKLHSFWDFGYSTKMTVSTSGADLVWKKRLPQTDPTAYFGVDLPTGLWMVNITLAFDTYYNAKYALKLTGSSGKMIGYEVASGDASWDTVKQHTFIINNMSASESSLYVNFVGSATAYIGINKNTGVSNSLALIKLI